MCLRLCLRRSLGCVRLSLRSQNRNANNDDKKSLIRIFWSLYLSTQSLLNYHVPANVCRNVFPYLKEKSNSCATYSYSGIQSFECDLTNAPKRRKNVISSFCPMTINTNKANNQSELDAKTRNRCHAREACNRGCQAREKMQPRAPSKGKNATDAKQGKTYSQCQPSPRKMQLPRLSACKSAFVKSRFIRWPCS